MKVPDVREKMLAQGFEPMGDTPAEFTKFLHSEIALWANVVKAAGIKPE
jgi:tripartite-type tricarboxylate transporter receptor subunit TctC